MELNPVFATFNGVHDHDDRLAPHALLMVAEEIRRFRLQRSRQEPILVQSFKIARLADGRPAGLDRDYLRRRMTHRRYTRCSRDLR